MSERPARESTAGSEEESLDERIAELLRLALPPAIAVAASVAGYLQGPPMAVLVLAAGALFATVALFWSSLRALFGETRLTGADAFAIGAPSTEEEQKRAVLRALKDIEFERSIGKLSEQDYRILAARYRAEAKRLLRVLDTRAQPTRERAEKLVKAHLMKQGLVRHGDGVWSGVELDDGRPAGANPFVDEPGEDGGEERSGKRAAAKKKTARDADSSDDEDAAAAADEAADEDAFADDESVDEAADDESADDEEDDESADDEEDDESADDEEDDESVDDEEDDESADDEEDDESADDEEDDEAANDEDEGVNEGAERHCANCGAVNDADALFCKKCGARFEEASA